MSGKLVEHPNVQAFLEASAGWLLSCGELNFTAAGSSPEDMWEEPRHQDGGASILHMGVTLYGRRRVTCEQGAGQPDVVLPCVPGGVYLGMLTGPHHQVRARGGAVPGEGAEGGGGAAGGRGGWRKRERRRRVPRKGLAARKREQGAEEETTDWPAGGARERGKRKRTHKAVPGRPLELASGQGAGEAACGAPGGGWEPRRRRAVSEEAAGGGRFRTAAQPRALGGGIATSKVRHELSQPGDLLQHPDFGGLSVTLMARTALFAAARSRQRNTTPAPQEFFHLLADSFRESLVAGAWRLPSLEECLDLM